MKKENTLQEVQEQIFELQEEREKCDVKLKQLQNQGKKLEKLANEKKRKMKKSKNAYPNVKMQTKEQRSLSNLYKAIPILKNLPLPLSMSLSVKS